MPPFGFAWLDVLGIVLFAGSTLAYHIGYLLWARRHPLETVKGKIHLYRRTWIKRVLESGDHIMAVQATRNLVMVASFMASSALLAMAVIINFMVQYVPGDLGLFDAEHVRIKLALLLSVLGFGFVTFLQALRDLNHFSVLVGADIDLIGHVEPVDGLTYLSNVANRAADRMTYGQRAFLYALPVVGWLFTPWALILLTLGLVFYTSTHLDFQKWHPPAAFRKHADEPRRLKPF